jgi:hypothetical protein
MAMMMAWRNWSKDASRETRSGELHTYTYTYIQGAKSKRKREGIVDEGRGAA